MNEKILEYAEQARLYAKSVFPHSIDDPTGWNYEYHKKFAELIVLECGYHADVFESLGCPVDMDPTETKPSDYIKKHFGVEE